MVHNFVMFARRFPRVSGLFITPHPFFVLVLGFCSGTWLTFAIVLSTGAKDTLPRQSETSPPPNVDDKGETPSISMC